MLQRQLRGRAMRVPLSDRLRYRVVDVLEGEPSLLVSLPLRASILSLLMLMAAPWRVSRELVFGSDPLPYNLKSALRSTLWIWNRSWIPFRFRMGTFFDIGWYLSAASCRRLEARGFLSDHPVLQARDRAQLLLSSIRDHAVAGEQAQLAAADRELQDLVNAVLNRSRVIADKIEKRAVPVAEPAVETDESPQPSTQRFDNERTKAALLDFDDLSRSVGLNYFLVSGTFLGVVRDGAFIGHDHDIDLGVFEAELHDGLIPALSESGAFRVTQLDYICSRRVEAGEVRYAFMEQPAIIRLAHTTGVSLDLFVHFADGDLVWHGSSVHRWDNRRFRLVDYAFLGRSFKGADDHDLYLTENYGSDWRIPKSRFNVNFDTPNMSFAGTANALVFFSWAVGNAAVENRAGRVKKYIDLLSSLGAVENREGEIRVR